MKSSEIIPDMGTILNKYSLFILLFGLFSLLSIQGFDVTDRGWHITNQYQLFEYSVSTVHINPIFFLSDIVGGLWLHLFERPNLLWQGIGGALLLSLCAFISASILENYFEKRIVFIFVLISALFSTAFFPYQIDYFTFPAFLTLIFLYLFNKIINESLSSKKCVVYAFALGSIFILIILSRFMLIMIVLIIPFIALYLWWTKHSLGRFFKGLEFALLGSFVSMGVVLICFYKFDILETFLELIYYQVIETKGEGYAVSNSMSSSVFLFLIQYFLSLIAVSLFFVGIVLIEKLKNRISDIWMVLIASLFTIMIIITSIIRPNVPYLSFLFPRGLVIFFIGLVVLLIVIYLYYHEIHDYRVALLLITSGTIMVINPLGSVSGIFKSVQAFWLVLPLSLLCIQHLGSQINNRNIKTISSLVPSILTILLLFAIFFQGVNVYRDDPNRLHLTTPFESPQLKGIYSTPERVKVTEELISVIESETEPGDYILLLNGIPMFYYLTDTRPALGQPWIDLYSTDRIVELERERENKGEIIPKLFIYSKVNTLDKFWPKSGSSLIEQYEHTTHSMKNRYIYNYQYFLLWENEAFTVYKNPNLKF